MLCLNRFTILISTSSWDHPSSSMAFPTAGSSISSILHKIKGTHTNRGDVELPIRVLMFVVHSKSVEKLVHNATILFRAPLDSAGFVTRDVREIHSRFIGIDTLRFSSHSSPGLPVGVLMIESNPNHCLTVFKYLDKSDARNLLLYVVHDSPNLQFSIALDYIVRLLKKRIMQHQRLSQMKSV